MAVFAAVVSVVAGLQLAIKKIKERTNMSDFIIIVGLY